VDENGESYIYGYVPIVVAKCGVFLKETATEIEGIFRLNGSEKRIRELKERFDSPPKYGKGLSWEGFTVHDAANVLRRYLNDLPEPVVPLDLYDQFRQPLKGATKPVGSDGEIPQLVEKFNMDGAIARYQRLITELPPLNRQLLLYLLDLLAVFAAKSDQNRMNSQNLAAIFQPGMLSHPAHAMAPDEYRLNQVVIIFLIENQDHFLVGMQGTAADEQTIQEVEHGTPAVEPPLTPVANRTSGVARSASNASAGAESVAKEGQVRRNKSTSSRRSRHSNGAPSPGSPVAASTPSGGLARSNTVPSKKSPGLPASRFAHRNDGAVPLTPLTPLTPATVAPPTVIEEVATPPEERQLAHSIVSTAASSSQAAPSASAGRSQEKLLDPHPEVPTPSKERKLPNIFQRSPTGEADTRPPNKLRKKMPNSAHPSAHSSTVSLPHSTAASPGTEAPNPLETIPSLNKSLNVDTPLSESPSEPTPRAIPTGQPNSLHPLAAEQTLNSKKSPPTSLHSSFNEGSELDQVDELEPVVTSPGVPMAEKKRRWRISHKKKDEGGMHPVGSPPAPASPGMMGSNAYAQGSTSSVGSSAYNNSNNNNRAHQTMTGESSDLAPLASAGTSSDTNNDGASTTNNDKDGKGITGWIKKFRDHKNVDQKRNKSPPAGGGGERGGFLSPGSTSSRTGGGSSRGGVPNNLTFLGPNPVNVQQQQQHQQMMMMGLGPGQVAPPAGEERHGAQGQGGLLVSPMIHQQQVQQPHQGVELRDKENYALDPHMQAPPQPISLAAVEQQLATTQQHQQQEKQPQQPQAVPLPMAQPQPQPLEGQPQPQAQVQAQAQAP